MRLKSVMVGVTYPIITGSLVICCSLPFSLRAYQMKMTPIWCPGPSLIELQS